MNLTEDIACGVICSGDRFRRNFVLPRYTPRKWWECDVFEVTKSGYFREYEVKLTLSDFKSDATKEQDFAHGWGAPKDVHRKHDLLAAGDSRGPCEFYFVASAGLLGPLDVPIWAGLIEVYWHDGSDFSTAGYFERELKAAPRLHKEKLDRAVADHARSVCYYRMHNFWRRLRRVAA